MKKDVNSTICKILLSICKEKNLSIIELEKAYGLQKDILRNIIRGKSKNPKFDTILTIAKTLNISIDSLTPNYNHTLNHIPWDPFLLIETIQSLEDIRKCLDIELNFHNAISIISKSYMEYIASNKKESIEYYISSFLLSSKNIKPL